MPSSTVLRSVILASASPRRLELLRSLGLEVEVRPSGYHEPDDPTATPLELAIAHARNKALHILRQAQDDSALLVAADTVVDLDGTALNKPVDAADAARMLRSLSGREHQVHTAFALRVPGIDAVVEEHATTRVRFYALSDAEIADYVATGEPMDKAGAYGIQGRAAALVESIAGDFYTVMGFPLARFVRTVRALGFSLPIAKESPIR
ncbi:MAG TPA: Maf family protein [Candidatus Baltobacteraceae bacterium]|nr:Maf family protein [Candidatus Baltobacteraceae bacterium]